MTRARAIGTRRQQQPAEVGRVGAAADERRVQGGVEVRQRFDLRRPASAWPAGVYGQDGRRRAVPLGTVVTDGIVVAEDRRLQVGEPFRRQLHFAAGGCREQRSHRWRNLGRVAVGGDAGRIEGQRSLCCFAPSEAAAQRTGDAVKIGDGRVAVELVVADIAQMRRPLSLVARRIGIELDDAGGHVGKGELQGFVKQLPPGGQLL